LPFKENILMRRHAAMLFVLCLACCPLFAQEGNATLTGFIQDRDKAFVPGVKVIAIDTDTNQQFQATTGKDGSYSILSLPVGPYRMQIEKVGFKTILKEDLFLHTQDALQINFQMAVGSVSESVTVTGGEANDSPAISMVVTREFVENMPLNGLSFQDLIALAPGTVSSAQGNGMYSINGQRDDANNFTVDGVAANTNIGAGYGSPGSAGYGSPGAAVSINPLQAASGVYPGQTTLGTTQALASTDSLQEFRIQTSGYSAEYGRQPGGQVEITTRSGTSTFHGSASDYFRNTALDARNWFIYPGLKQAEHQNDFGGTLGGPVSLPRVHPGELNGTFFFLSYEGLRLLLPGFEQGEVPTAAFRAAAAPGVQPFLNAFPLPNANSPLNSDGISALLSAGYSNPSSLDSGSVRIDHDLGAKLRIFGRFATTPSQTDFRDADPQSNLFQGSSNPWTLTLGATTLITKTMTDELRFNYTKSSGNSVEAPDSFGGAMPFSRNLLLPDQY
jgi:hypothetical protein